MNITCQCPAAAAIPDLENVACAQSFGQIQKVAFVRLRKADGTRNSFAVTGSSGSETGSIKKLASWETKLAADDGSKVIVTPYISGPADSGGDVRMTSGGNDDLGGIPDVLGSNPVQFAGQLRGVPQSLIKSLKELVCEANAGNIGVFLFDESGKIEAIQDQTTETTHYPIPIRALFVSDKIHGNYDAKDYNTLSWYYQEGYSDDLVIVTPDNFNPLTDLINGGTN